ncbi:MAG: aminoglycoside phosphotransferase family protein, partial [Ktedonobacteraceae bacterium]|nr:aminoglycoside phosphotransferase family protein [Ktedonobacteraceae bacterium]
WGDATIGDPALDFVGLLHCRDHSFTERVRSSYRGHLGSSFRQRTAFYLRCLPFHELLYASYTQSETNLAHGLASLHAMLER